MFHDPSIRSVMLSNRRGPDWSYCLRCESVRPPRAHHCRRCDVCILRFDHHCTFLGQCVGYRNISSFLHLLVYSSIICLLSTCFNLPYFVNVLTPDWRLWQRVLCLLNPVPFFCLGWFSIPHFLLSIFTSACLVLGPAFAIFFVHHFLQVCRNQTTVEILIASPAKAITVICHEDELRPVQYDMGRAANLEQVLGPRWLLTFFFPFINSPPTSDGLSFPVRIKSHGSSSIQI